MTHETRDADADTPSRRHQVGAERSTEPLPVLHSRPSALRLVLGRLAIVVTVLSWAMYVITTVLRRVIENELTTLGTVIETVVYLGIVTLLSFSALMYLVSRQGAYIRFRSHQRVPRAQVDRHFSVPDPRHGITVLIPSYVEETHVVVKTIWSAALQEFPDLQVVLLIDDPPNPCDPERLHDLETTRRLGETVMSALAAPSSRLTHARDTAGVRLRGVAEVSGAELSRLTSEYRWAAHWLEQMAEDWEVVDHTDQFFVHQVLGDLARDLRTTVTALEGASREHGSLPLARVLQLYDRLAWTFTASVRTFERKQYASLSHEANKAMNLNAYISLMGHSWKRVETQRGVILREVYEGEYADLEVPDSEYLLTLDADSMLLREYCLRLVYLLECPENERVAVAQTPYCSYRGAPTRMERIAAATTDIQHILHQGLTYYDATFWVGANAVIRKRALDDIAQVSTEGARTVTTYIQDRTVIEDTESSVDLGLHRWHLVNYPERLSYSATPPDFGSLVVQRRRWANGGLLILPKFIQQMRVRRNTSNAVHLTQAALRINYMASIAWASIGLVIPPGLPLRLAPPEPVGHRRGGSVLPVHGPGPQGQPLQAHGRVPHLRLQPDPPGGQRGRHAEVRPAGPDEREDPLRPHAEGLQPHGRALALRVGAAGDHRAVLCDLRARLAREELGQRGLRRVQRGDVHVGAGVLHRGAQLPGGPVLRDPRLVLRPGGAAPAGRCATGALARHGLEGPALLRGARTTPRGRCGSRGPGVGGDVVPSRARRPARH